MKHIWMIPLLSLALTACVSTGYQPGAIEPYLTPPEKGPYSVVTTDTAEVSSYLLFWFLPVTPVPDAGAAITQLVNKHAADAAINIREMRKTQYWLTGTVYTVQVQATLIRYE